MYKKHKTNQWFYICNEFKHDFGESDQENESLDLWIKYKIYHPPGFSAEQAKNISQKVEECRVNLEGYKKRFDGDTIDINLFWASPLCVEEKDRRKHHRQTDIIR